MEPLFALLDSLVQLTFVLGLSLGLLGFMAAGLAFMIPGEDNNRRGKLIAKSVFVGMVLLLSAHFIVSFLVNELGGVVCQ
jgi:ABC-type Fe3+-siderophore transport system permease subunit